jgi:hypothetical protein
MRVFLGTLFEGKRFCGAPWANIDPDPGSLIFQAEAASLISAGLWIARLRKRIEWLLVGRWLIEQPNDNPRS